MNSESETVEERARVAGYVRALNLHLKAIEHEVGATRETLAAFERSNALASSLLQDKEQCYKDEREAQGEFYLPTNPTAEDISQARAIIAQQKSQLFEKEQRIKEFETAAQLRAKVTDLF